MKILKIFIIIIFVIGGWIYLFFPRFDADTTFSHPAWWNKCLYSFCKYQVPDGYTFSYLTIPDPSGNIERTGYREGTDKDKYYLIFKNKTSGQLIVLARVRGFQYVPFDQIKIDTRKSSKPYNLAYFQITDDFRLELHQPIFFFLKEKDVSKLPKNLSLRGVTLEKKEQYQTNVADVLYFKGTFNKIGFFKKMPFPKSFAMPIFDFQQPSKGALAILNNKKADETIIVASAIPIMKDFDESEFKSFISTITFEKEEFTPYTPKGAKLTTRNKYSVSI